MFERTLIVKYITLKTCFCYLSDKHSKSVKQSSVAKLIYNGNKVLYVSVGPYLSNLKENEIAINSVYAHSLQIEENDIVLFTSCNNASGIRSLNIIPESEDDFEILELMAENVQQTLLDQIRIVSDDQKVLIWISNSLHTAVKIENVKPVTPGLLNELTEVVLKPPVLKRNEILNTTSTSWNINGFLKHYRSNKTLKSHVLNKYDKLELSTVFRLQPVDEVVAKIPHFNERACFKVYVEKNALPGSYLKISLSEDCLLFTLHLIPTAADHNYLDETNHMLKSIVVQLCVIENLSLGSESKDGYFIPLFVHKCIFEHYTVNVGAKVILGHFNKPTEVKAIDISSNKIHFNEFPQKFKSYLAENCKFGKLLLNPEFPINIGNGCSIKLKFTPSNVIACLIDSDFIRNCTFTVTVCDLPATVGIVSTVNNLNCIGSVCLDCSNFKSILDSCMKCWKLNVTRHNGELQNILVVGKAGVGKTTLATAFAEILISQIHVHVEAIKCKSVKGKSLDSLHKLFTGTFTKLIYYQPSMLLLDDLQVICEKVTESDAPTQESDNFNKVSELLADLLKQYLPNNFICVFATTEATTKLNQHIFSSRGEHLFKNVFSINELNKNDRRTFLNFSLSKRTGSADIDVESFAVRTEGFVVQDLVDFSDKCVFESFKDESSKVLSSHCENALKNTSSLNLRNIKLHSPGDRNFSSVGGLDDVKRILVECMLWPAQYANIFGKAPLRLQSGLLLYGPPGTGKTILAGAAAKQCGLRLISIKGPELLSKYIGASEQAVRDVFQKAQSAKPCILFFDEFDSLAPRRGHDNTGVTDRVVNQFLTQLDGVEALVGVCVLAATSRPDLLDPALLRPGRLDRQILCPLPDREARCAILKALSKNVTFSSDVDLDKIADETEGYSGADLQGVLYTAQLASVEQLLDGNEHLGLENMVEINQHHLEEAVKNTRPSLTRQEKLKYQRIYAKFQGNGKVTDIKTGEQRATLA